MRHTWSTVFPLAASLTLSSCVLGKDDTAARDIDRDGYPEWADCDDEDPSIYPGADERCDGQDDDCDGAIDENAVDAAPWYPDDDGDGYGSPEGEEFLACAQPNGYASEPTDCDDSVATVHPGAEEVCNGVDDDCDGESDEDAVDPSAWYPDDDGDGYGDNRATPSMACTGPTGMVADNSDCNDRYETIHPGADEVCDDLDNDCNGVADDGAIDALTWYPDLDGDGYGDPDGTAVVACSGPTGMVVEASDCDDADDDTNPVARDFCDDGVDQDCDGADKRCPYTGTLMASDASGAILGVAEDGGLWRVTILGDIDGDGLDDLSLGAPAAGGDSTGAVYVLLGPIGTSTQTVEDADVVLVGEGPIHYTGDNIARGGDTDGDGLADFLVSAPYAADVADFAGKVYLLRGSTDPSSITLNGAWATFLGEGLGDQLGGGLAAGDVDGDGTPDIVLGAMSADRTGTDSGAAYLFWGGLSSGSYGCGIADIAMPGTAGSLAGKVAVGDIFGEGFGDVLVGAPDSSLGYPSGGAVDVFSGSDLATEAGGEGSTARATITTACASCGFGQFTAAGEDLNGDSVPDALVIDNFYPSGFGPPGAFYLFSGSLCSGTTSATTAEIRILGDNTHSSNVRRMAADGDINGDGATDLVIASDTEDQIAPNGGAIRLFYGPLTSGLTSVFDADAVVFGLASSDYFGYDVSIGGDIDGDGFDDIVVLSTRHDGGAGPGGEAFLFPGGVP